MTLTVLDQRRAALLREEAHSLQAAGRDAEAIAKYVESSRLEPDRMETYYNLGLIYKYQANWEKSFECNQSANRLRPDDPGARWNLAIAATALRRWDVARRIWRNIG
ncbi:MAG: tetratricopeptide repeat protein, partial [Usitatibacteraceae bacterium]